MTRNELQTICNEAKKFTKEIHLYKRPKSDACTMVLELMCSTDEKYRGNYCASLSEILNAFPEIDRAELEKELDIFV